MDSEISQSVRESAHREAAVDDEFAICCSDGNIESAESKTEARELLNEMRTMRRSLNPTGEYGFEVEVFDTDYEYAGLWSCDGCGEEFIVTTRFGPAAHEFGYGRE